MPNCEQEIERLITIDDELAAADAEFEHQQRRYGDRKVRDGGNDWGFADDLKQISRNRRKIASERAEIAAKLIELKKQKSRYS